MKHSRVYGLVHIYAELVPLLVNDLDGSNDFPNREKGQFGQNGGVGLNEGIGETFSEGFEYAEDCEVSNATEGMDASVLRNVWNYLMLVHDEEILVNGKEGKVPGYEIDHSASSDPGNYDSSDSEAEDTGIKRSRRSITYDPDNPKWLVGQLLYAIGRGGNNQMFPISWGVVELESAVTWKWFLDHLMADPNVANGVPQCDDVGNNIMKAFNGWILDARAKLTVRMLEEITVTIMNRILVKRNCALKWKTPIAPEVFKIFGKNRVEAGDWALEYNGDDGYDIIKGDKKHVVGLGNKTCMCRAWILQAFHALMQSLIIIPGPLKMKNADTGSTVHQASTAAKLNQPAQETFKKFDILSNQFSSHGWNLEFIGDLQSVRYIQVKLGKGSGGDAKPMNVVFSFHIPINPCVWKSITSSVHGRKS
ncbi:hypothetical protein POTOM_029876 [Populus tomentosa]|uniref:MULE transposase domain-containing protein n=1 Tax=Populus tomentosa TaxID=118781 RepID=A0A8X7Z615_POPTO|nr:hypothetical protein POTOM_029876 [Populus tomentosa]